MGGVRGIKGLQCQHLSRELLGDALGCYLACMLSLLCAGSPGAISVQRFLSYHKALHGKRGLKLSPIFMSACHHSLLTPPSSWGAAYFPLLAAVKAASEFLGLLCS